MMMFLKGTGFHLQGEEIDMLSKLNSKNTKFQTENMQKTGSDISPEKSRCRRQVCTWKMLSLTTRNCRLDLRGSSHLSGWPGQHRDNPATGWDQGQPGLSLTGWWEC